MSDRIRVLIADDQQLVREGLHLLLDLIPDIQVVGEAHDGIEAVEQAQQLSPDVVLMDVQMPKLDGVAATRQTQENCPEAKVIILTTFDDDEYVFEGLRAGALGYLLKDVSGQALAGAIRTVAAGGALIEPSVARKVLAEFAQLAPPARPPEQGLPEPLTEREREVLGLLASGLTNREIATRLSLAEGTVKNYVTSILQKLGVRDRTQAAVRARELGVV
jgi:DNA-binding NarL/FixJ family response regulator